VNFDGTTLRDRLDTLRSRIAAAAARAGRAPGEVVLIGVTKTVAADRVAEAIALGVLDLGENRVQEAQEKIATVGPSPARWHLIGHLQRNKAGRAVELFERIHGVDGFEVAEALSKRAEARGLRLPALLEVNVSGEVSKFGVAPDAAEALLARIADLPGIALDGLMTVGAPVERAEDARPGFARLRELRDRLETRLRVKLPQLSMGMSGDFETAVEEGSTMVRVGSALFGARNQE
jgi:pyridoxal phosphate enzyme (YggS family)